MTVRRLFENSVTIGLLFLVLFTPLAFGTVQPWSTLVLQLTVLLMTAAWLARMWADERLVVHTTWLYAPIVLFIGYALLQTLPLPVMEPAPGGLANTFMAHAAVIQKLGEAQTYTISLCRHATFAGAARLAVFGLVFFLVINELRTVGRVRAVLYVLVAVGFCIALFALVQKFTWTGKIYWLQETPANAGPYGPFVNYDHYGGYINMIIPLGIALLMTRLSTPQRILVGFMTGVMATSMLLSRSRGAVISFIGALVVFLLLLVISRKRRKRLVLINALLLLAFIGVFVYWVDFGGFLARIRTIGLESNFFNPRLDVWKDAMGIVNDFGVFGTGLGTFSEVFPRYQSTHLNLFWRYLHNDYLQIFCETGIVGFTAVAAFTVLFWWNILSHLRRGTNQLALCLLLGTAAGSATMFIHSLFDFNLHINANAFLFAVMLGITHVLTCHLVEDTEPSDTGTPQPEQPVATTKGPASFRDPYAEFEEKYRRKQMMAEMQAQQPAGGELSAEEMQRDLERIKAQFPEGLPPELGGVPIAIPTTAQPDDGSAPGASPVDGSSNVTAPAPKPQPAPPSTPTPPSTQTPADRKDGKSPEFAEPDDPDEERGEYLDVQLGTLSGALWSILSIGLLVMTLGLPLVRWYLGDRHYREYLDIVRLNPTPGTTAVTADPNRTGFMRFWADVVLRQPAVNDVDRLKEHYLTQAVQLDPLRPVYYHHLGHLYVSRAARPGLAPAIRDSLLEKALDFHTKAVSRSPLNAAYWFSCAWTLGNLGEKDDGLDILRYVMVLAPEREFYKKHYHEFQKLFTQKPKPTYDDAPATPRAIRKATSAAQPAAKPAPKPSPKPETPPAAPPAAKPTAPPTQPPEPKSAPVPAPAPKPASAPVPPATSSAPKSGAPVRRSTSAVAPARPATAQQSLFPTTATPPRASTAPARQVLRSTASAPATATAAPVRPAAAPSTVTPAPTVKPSTAPAPSPTTTPAPRRRGITTPVGGW